MRLYNLIEKIEPIKSGRFKYPGIKIDVYGVVFYVIAEFSNIIWKIAPGNKKIWQAAKQSKNVSFLDNVAPALESAVYQLLDYLNTESDKKYDVYTLHGNTIKAANLYRTWNSPPAGYTVQISNRPRQQGINYIRDET